MEKRLKTSAVFVKRIIDKGERLMSKIINKNESAVSLDTSETKLHSR
jgi:hypothetical protein